LNGDWFGEFSVPDIVDKGEVGRKEVVRGSCVNKTARIGVVDGEIGNERFF
jgi:hypothetical protein